MAVMSRREVWDVVGDSEAEDGVDWGFEARSVSHPDVSLLMGIQTSASLCWAENTVDLRHFCQSRQTVDHIVAVHLLQNRREVGVDLEEWIRGHVRQQ